MGSSKPLRASTMGRRRNLRASSNSPPPPPTIGRSNSTRALNTKTTRSTKTTGEPSTPLNRPSSLMITGTKSQRNYTIEEKKWIFERAERVISGDCTWEDITADFNVTYNRTKEARMIKGYYTLQQREIKHGRGADPRGINGQSSTEIPALKKTARRKLVFVDPAESDDRDELGPDITPKGKGTLPGTMKSDTARTVTSKSTSERPRSASDAVTSGPEWLYESGAHKRKKSTAFEPRAFSPEEASSKTMVSAQEPGVTLRHRGGSEDQVLRNPKSVEKPRKAAEPVKESDNEDESNVGGDWVGDVESEDGNSDVAGIVDFEGYQESTASVDTGTNSERSEGEEEEDQQASSTKRGSDGQDELEDSASDEKAIGIEKLPFTGELDISANEDSAICEIGNQDRPRNEKEKSTSGEGAKTLVTSARETTDLRNDEDSNNELSKLESPKEELRGKPVPLKSILEREDDKDDKSGGNIEDDKDDEEEETTSVGFVTPIPINFGPNITAPSILPSPRKTTNEIKPSSLIDLNQVDLGHSNSGYDEMEKDSVSRAGFDAASQADPQKQIEGNVGEESVPVKRLDIVYQDVVQITGIENSVALRVLEPSPTDGDNVIQVPVSPGGPRPTNSLTGHREGLNGNSAYEELGKTKTESSAELAVRRGRAKKGLTSPKKPALTNTPSTANHGGDMGEDLGSFSVVAPSGEIFSLGAHKQRPSKQRPSKSLLETEGLLEMPPNTPVEPLMTFAHARRSIGGSKSLEAPEKDMEGRGNTKGVAGIGYNAREPDAGIVSKTNQEKPRSITDQGISQTTGAIPILKKNIKRAIPQALVSSIESVQLPIKRAKLAHAGNENRVDRAGAVTTCGVSVGPTVVSAPTDISPPFKTQLLFTKKEGGIRRIYVDRGAIGTSVPSAIPGPITWRRIYEQRASLLDRVLTTEFRELVEALKEGKSDRRLFIYTCSQSAIEWITVHHLKARKTQWRTQWGIQVPPRDQALIEEAVKLLEERKNSGKEIEFKRVWGGKEVYEGLILEAQRECLEAHGQASSATTS